MKKAILLLTIFFIVIPFFAQQPLVKFYLNNGNPKIYNIADIDSLNFIKSKLSYQMTIFENDSLKFEFDILDINSIIFDNNSTMLLFLADTTVIHNISSIDSIIFIPNTCSEITIGTQVWSCKNLDVDHYSNGDTIPQVNDPNDWYSLTSGAWCYYNNSDSLGAIYGKLYNWYAVNDPRGLAPAGWRIPSDTDWSILTIYLGYNHIAGGNLKETGTVHWQSPNFGATNEVGFTALPGGARGARGTCIDLGITGYWWTSSDYYQTHKWGRYISNDTTIIYKHDYGILVGLSVRCVKN
jgi:uncharacterized protein (TIGR02145 family)